MKYVIVELNGCETPIITADFIGHIDIAKDHNIISAGFVSFCWNSSGKIDVICWGESIGLNLKSRGHVDGAIIKLVIEKF